MAVQTLYLIGAIVGVVVVGIVVLLVVTIRRKSRQDRELAASRSDYALCRQQVETLSRDLTDLQAVVSCREDQIQQLQKAAFCQLIVRKQPLVHFGINVEEIVLDQQIIKIPDEIHKRLGIYVPRVQFFQEVTRQGTLGAQKSKIHNYQDRTGRLIMKLDSVYQAGLGAGADVASKINLFRMVA